MIFETPNIISEALLFLNIFFSSRFSAICHLSFCLLTKGQFLRPQSQVLGVQTEGKGAYVQICNGFRLDYLKV